MIKKIINSKSFMIVIIILLIIAVAAAGTYAWFTWKSPKDTKLHLTIGEIAKVTFDTGNEIKVEDLAPVYNYFDGEKTTFSIENKVKDGTEVEYVISIDVTSITEELKKEDFKFALVKEDGEKSSSDNVTYGSFKSANDNQRLEVGTGKLDEGTNKFTFYIYIDGNDENDLDMEEKSFQGTLIVSAREKKV